MREVDEKTNIEISVVICAYNEEKRLYSCLESLSNQDFDPRRFEIIIVDDESLDQMPEMARRWAVEQKQRLNISYYRIKHGGLSVARNTGIHYARGQLIAFMDADAHADESWLRNLVQPFRRDPSIAIVAGRVENLNDDSAFAKLVYRVIYRPWVIRNTDSKLTGTNMAFRPEVFEVTGGFFDAFDRRGDETSVALKYFQARPDSKEAYAEDAIVFNEHAETLKELITQQYCSGRMSCLIALNISLSDSPSSIALKSAVKFLSLAFYPALLMQVIFQGPWAIFLVLFAAWFGRHLYSATYFLEAFRQVRRDSGVLMGLLGLMFAVQARIYRDAGFIIEAIRGLSGRRLTLAHSAGEVIDTV